MPYALAAVWAILSVAVAPFSFWACIKVTDAMTINKTKILFIMLNIKG